MFVFTESIEIVVPKEAVWDVMRDVRDWWPPSNPEHASLEVPDGTGEIGLGTRLRIRERIAGIPGEAVGENTQLEPGQTVTWEASEARYRLAGVRFTVAEGVTWSLDGTGPRTRVSARVWAVFPASWYGGRLLEWGFTWMGGVDKDRKHARTELVYLKERLEAPGAAQRTSTE